MKKAPWAKLTMRMMPKISVRPQPRKNSKAACDSAFRHCAMRNGRRSIRQLSYVILPQAGVTWSAGKVAISSGIGLSKPSFFTTFTMKPCCSP